jgi:hypothetical protein
MNITKDVITDLLPLYQAGEVSDDTIKLVEAYLHDHPDLAREAKTPAKNLFPKTSVVSGPNLEELSALRKAKRIIRLRATVMALAIFFSLCPFSFIHTENRTYFLFSESPQSAVAYGAVGIVFWAIWLTMKMRARGL